MSLRKDARRIFQAALEAADPVRAVERFVHRDGDTLAVAGRNYDLAKFKRILVLGAGKASPSMARAIESILGRQISAGLVNTRYGHSVPLKFVEIHEAGHPVPDANGVAGARRIAAMAQAAGRGDLVIFLISGGASALTPYPVPPITLAQKQKTTKLLLDCGASIHEINTVRKHISAFKGGQLARLASPATVVTLMLSDVIGDSMDVIGSGPTVPDPSTFAQAIGILDKFDLLRRVPANVLRRLEGGTVETPKPGDPVFSRTRNVIVGSNRLAVDAAAQAALSMGYRTMVLSTFVEGETREIARMHAAILKEIRASRRPLRAPACLISGGETTVTIRGNGKGGRNQEFVLAAIADLPGWDHVAILSAGTDGTDGPTDAAGAVADGSTLDRAHSIGLDPQDFLRRNDSYHFFQPLNDLIITGPTGTNVMDVRILLLN